MAAEQGKDFSPSARNDNAKQYRREANKADGLN
jgi:hypothetical protein